MHIAFEKSVAICKQNISFFLETCRASCEKFDSMMESH